MNSPAVQSTLPEPEAIIAGFAPDLTPAAKVAAMLAAAPAQGDVALIWRLPSGRVFTYSPSAVPVVVGMLGDALDRTSASFPATWPMLAATYGDTSYGGGGAAMVGGAFTAIGFDHATLDTHKAFDTATGIYTVPQDGFYLAELNFRIADGNIAGASYGIGVDTAAKDSPAFAWNLGRPQRQGQQYQRLAAFKKGDQLRAFYYFDGKPSTYIGADLTILRVR